MRSRGHALTLPEVLGLECYPSRGYRASSNWPPGWGVAPESWSLWRSSAEGREHFELEHQALPICQFLVPFFFVLTGAQVDWRLLLDGSIMGIALA